MADAAACELPAIAPAGAHDAVLFFDGECAFCNRTVGWILRHDRRRRLRVAPLRSELARQLLPPALCNPLDEGTVVLVEGERISTRSTAVIRVLRHLGGTWAVAAALLWCVPRPLRDAAYRFVAKHRHAMVANGE